MITKLGSVDSNVDWDAVNKATEVERTYLVTDRKDRQFFKMYKPSEAERIFKKKGWTGKIISTLDRRRY